MATQKWVRVASMQTSPSRVRPSSSSTMRRETSSGVEPGQRLHGGAIGPDDVLRAPRELGHRPVVSHIDGQVAALHRAEEHDAVGEQRHALVGIAVKLGPQLADGEPRRRGLGRRVHHVAHEQPRRLVALDPAAHALQLAHRRSSLVSPQTAAPRASAPERPECAAAAAGRIAAMRRAFVVVLDACGVGAAADAADYGDAGTNTLGHLAEHLGGLELPALQRLGLGSILPLAGMPPAPAPVVHGRLRPLGPGKDSTAGHWGLMGVTAGRPPTYPSGFPAEVIDVVRAAGGRGVICNRPDNGLTAIEDFGAQHVAQRGADRLHQSGLGAPDRRPRGRGGARRAL